MQNTNPGKKDNQAHAADGNNNEIDAMEEQEEVTKGVGSNATQNKPNLSDTASENSSENEATSGGNNEGDETVEKSDENEAIVDGDNGDKDDESSSAEEDEPIKAIKRLEKTRQDDKIETNKESSENGEKSGENNAEEEDESSSSEEDEGN